MIDNHCDNCGEFGDATAHAEECPIILRAEIARLTADLEAKDKGYRDLHEQVHGLADIWTKVEWLLADRDEWQRRAIERGWEDRR
jgi:hypothetical protein